jgi:hypothetical protein
MPAERHPSAGQQARAEDALSRVRDAWLAEPAVRGVMVGLLRDEDGALTDDVGLVVLVDAATAETTSPALPDAVDDVRVEVRAESPGPEKEEPHGQETA